MSYDDFTPCKPKSLKIVQQLQAMPLSFAKYLNPATANIFLCNNERRPNDEFKLKPIIKIRGYYCSATDAEIDVYEYTKTM